MKLLILNEYCQPFVPGGAEASMMQAAKSMSQRGFDVTIATPNYGTLPSQDVDGVRIVRFPFPAKLAEGSRKTVRAWWHTSIFWWLYSSIAVLRIVSKIRPNVIHVHGKFSLVSAIVARFFYGTPVFFTARDYRALCNYGLCITTYKRRCGAHEYWRWEFPEYMRIYTKARPQDWVVNALFALRGRIWSSVLRRCALAADKVVCVSAAVEEIYKQSGAQNTTVIFNIQKPLPINERVSEVQHRAIAVGKLSPGKGGGFLPGVIEESLRLDPELTWEVYTSGGLLYDSFISLLKPYIERGQVIVSGYIPNDQLLERMSSSAVLVVPSVWQEPLTRLALESQSVGTPIVITDTGGSAEVVQDGVAGKVLPLDESIFARGVVQVAQNTHEYREEIAQRHEQLLSTFCTQPIEQQEALYRAALIKKSSLGVLLPPGGSFTSLDKHGQKSRFMFYIRKYASEFDHVYVFVYEKEGALELPKNVTLVCPPRPMGKRLYSFLLPWYHAKILRQCSVLRVTQMDGVIPAIISTLFLRVPYVSTFGYKYAEFAALNGRAFFAQFMRVLERLGIRYAHAVIYTTSEIKKSLIDRVGPWLAPKLWFIPNGVDTTAFVPGQRDPQTLLFVGRLEKQKNLFALIEAIALIKDEYTPRAIWIGRGSQKEALLALAQRRGISLEIIDRVDHAELPAYFGNAGIFTLVSHIEGMPKVLVEAMGAGCCPVVSDADGNRILVEDGKTGIVVGTTPESIAEGLREALSNAEKQKEYGDAARSFIVDHYDLNVQLDREIAALKTVSVQSPPLWRRVLIRPWVSLLKLSKRGSGFSMRVVKWLGRASERTHPKHLFSPTPLWALDHIAEDSTVLDVGCSAGSHTLSVACKAGFVYGFDYDQKAIEQARRVAAAKNIKSVIFSVGDATRPFSFAQNSVDHVLLLDILEHVHKRDAVMSECVRVLKPGGTLLLALPSSETSWKKLQRSVGLPSATDPDHKIEYTLAQMKDLCKKAGLTTIHIEPVVIDTPWIGIADTFGALMPSFYKWYAQRRKDNAIKSPSESIGFRLVARKN